PQGGAPANVPATCAALNYLGSATIGCPPYQPPTTGVGDGTGQFTAAMAASKVVRVPAGTYPICNLAPQQDNQVLACDGPASAFVPTTGCTNMVLVNSATAFRQNFVIRGCTFVTTTATNAINLNGRAIRNVLLDSDVFDQQNGTAITAIGMDGLRLRNLYIYGRGTGQAVSVLRGTRN